MGSVSIADELIQAFNQGDWERFAALCSPDIAYEEKGSNRTTKGIEQFMELVQGWKTAFPDLTGRLINRVDCGNNAAIEITWTGKNDGPMELPSGTLPATGRKVEFDDAQIYAVEDGRVTSIHNYGDFLTMLTQLGVIPG